MPGLDLSPPPEGLDEVDLASRTAQTLLALGGLHRSPPAPVVPVDSARPEVPDLAVLLRAARREATRGLSLLRWPEWRTALRQAREETERTWAGLRDEAERAHRDDRERVRRSWDLLVDNHEPTALATLGRVFAGTGVPVAAVGLAAADVTLVVLVPGPEVLPQRYPHRSADGDVTLRRVTAVHTSDWYRQLVAGRVVAAGRQAFETCPSVETATVVAVLDAGPGAAGEPRARPVLATRLSKARLDRLPWEAVTAWDVLEMAGHDTVAHPVGRVGQLRPIELADQPGLATLAALIELADD
ncbi:MAG: hypothetical protein ACXVET_14985 [Nocardioidaceae bacterium]